MTIAVKSGFTPRLVLLQAEAVASQSGPRPSGRATVGGGDRLEAMLSSMQQSKSG